MASVTELVRIALTIAVPVIPLGARRHFIERSTKGIDELRSSVKFGPSSSFNIGLSPNYAVSSFPSSADRSCICQGEPGFGELETSIREQGLLSGNAEKFCLAAGDIEDVAGALNLDLPSKIGHTHNVIFYVVYSTGNSEQLIFHPANSDRTLRLVELNRWARYAVRTRSEWITIFLALLLLVYTVLI